MNDPQVLLGKILENTKKIKGLVVTDRTPRALRMENIIINESGLPSSHQAMLAELMGAMAGEALNVKKGHGSEVTYAVGGMVVLVNDVYATSYTIGEPLLIVTVQGKAMGMNGVIGNFLPLHPIMGDVRLATEAEILLWLEKYPKSFDDLKEIVGV